MNNPGWHEVHIFCADGDLRLLSLCTALPDLRLNTNCDPANIPEGTLCYEYPSGQEWRFEAAARVVGLGFEWGISAVFDAVFAVGDYMYVTNTAGFLVVFDITDPTTPANVGSLAIDGTPTGVWVDNHIAYVVNSDGELFVVNINDPTAPELYPDGVAQSDENWSFVRVTGETAILSGSAASGVALYNVATFPPTEIQITENSTGAQATLQGRRMFWGETSGNPRALLRNARVGGFRCPSMATDRLQAGQIAAEKLDARHGNFKGDVVAHSVTVAEGGRLTVSGTIVLGAVWIMTGTGDPNTVVTAPIASMFLRTDTGAIYRNTDGAEAWTAM